MNRELLSQALNGVDERHVASVAHFDPKGIYASSERKEDMFYRKNEKVYAHRRPKITFRSVLIAAMLMLALATTALAVGSYTGFFDTVFGNNAIKSDDKYVVKMDGVKEDYVLPARERVDVDTDIAEALVGNQVVNVEQTITVQGVTFTVENMVMDENGIGVLTYTMENPNGFDGLVVSEYGSTFWFEDPAAPGAVRVPNIMLIDKKGNELSFLDVHQFMTEGNSTETKKEIVVYFAAFDALGDTESLRMIFAVAKDHDPNAELFTDFCDEGSISIPLGELVSAQALSSNEGWTVSVSPMGMVLTQPVGQDYGINYGTGDIVIHYSDGTDYVVDQNEPYVSNKTMSGYNSYNNIFFVFNRLIDPAVVESATINVKIWDSEANETSFNLTFAK